MLVARVELETRIVDEERIPRGYATLIPGLAGAKQVRD